MAPQASINISISISINSKELNVRKRWGTGCWTGARAPDSGGFLASGNLDSGMIAVMGALEFPEILGRLCLDAILFLRGAILYFLGQQFDR
jgi:hypothetical protein